MTAACLLALLAAPPADDGPLPAGCLARLGTARFRADGNGDKVVGSPDGRYVLVAGFGVTSVFETATGRPVRPRTPAQDDTVMEIDTAFDPAGGLVSLTLDDNGDPAIVRSRPGDFAPAGTTKLKRFEFSGSNGLSPDGRLLATASGKRLLVHDTLSGKRPTRLRARLPDGVNDLRFSADGRWLFAQSGNQLLAFDRVLGALAARLRFPEPPMPFAVSADGARVAADVQGKVVVRDVLTGKRVARYEPQDGGAQQLAFVGRHLVLAESNSLTVYDPDRRRAVQSIFGAPFVSGLAGLADGRTVAALNPYGGVLLFDVPTGRRLPQSADPDGDVAHLRALPDGRVLVYSDRWLAWDVASRTRTPLGPAGPAAAAPIHGLGGLGGTITSIETGVPVAVSADGKLFARLGTGTGDDAAKPMALEIADVATGRVSRSVPFGRANGGVAVWFAADGRSAAGVSDGRGYVWELATGRATEGKLDGVQVHSPEMIAGSGSLVLAAVTRDNQNPGVDRLVGHDLSTGRRLFERKLDGHLEAVRLSADGRTAVIVFRSETDTNDWLEVFDARTGATARKLPVESAGATGVALSADGRTVGVTGYDTTTRLYETATGTVRAAFEHPWATNLNAAHFSPDGSRLATASANGMVYVWDVAGRALPPPATDAKGLNALWASLGDPDGAAGFAAVRGLARVPADAVALLGRKLPPAEGVDAAAVARWANELDSPRYAVRAAAAAAVEKVADRATAQLSTLAAKTPSAEVRGRLLGLVDAATGANPVNLRAVRAVEVIEWILNDPSAAAAHPAARRLRAAWAAGQPGARLTSEAIASQRR